MQNAIKSIKAFNNDNRCWNVIVETPKGSNVKYALDKKTGLLIVKKALPEGMVTISSHENHLDMVQGPPTAVYL